MCKWGTTVDVEVTIPAHLSYTGKARKKTEKIDACIAPIVEALEKGGIKMTGSCCGHGKTYGRISLLDGRNLIIIPSLNKTGSECPYCGTRSVLNKKKDNFLCPNLYCPVKIQKR